MRGQLYSRAASGAFRAFGTRSVLQPPIRVTGAPCISVGSDVWVGPGCWLNALSNAAGRSVIEIGDGTNLAGDCTIAAAEHVHLGHDVLLARGVYVADHAHAFDDVNVAIIKQGIDRIAPVRIEDGAWLGQNVVVCPGVTIGRNAVIGANAVVTRDVPPCTVAVGAPAKVVRSLLLGEHMQAA